MLILIICQPIVNSKQKEKLEKDANHINNHNHRENSENS